LKKDNMEAYLRKTTEQEAYLNQNNPWYIAQRPLRSRWHYSKNKIDFILEDYTVVIQ
jgi:hypothetical protein